MNVRPIQILRQRAKHEEIDYVFISSCLQDYRSPRDVITRMLKSGDLIRVKKGVYVFGPSLQKRPCSLEILGNQIYGPSYISREYALSFYGMIPEGVHEVTSMTTKRSKAFETPLGTFSYHHLSKDKYSLGVHWVPIGETSGALMATPEKALVDFLYYHKEQAKNRDNLMQILYEGYRLNPEQLGQLDIARMVEIVSHYSNSAIKQLPEVIKHA